MKKGILLLSILVFQGCLIRELKSPDFQKSSEETLEEVKAIGDFENVEIEWSASSFNGETKNILLVSLTTMNDFPNDEHYLKSIGKAALQIVINSITNESDFDEFHVDFIIIGSAPLVETSKSQSFTFMLSEFDQTKSM